MERLYRWNNSKRKNGNVNIRLVDESGKEQGAKTITIDNIDNREPEPFELKQK